MKVPRATHPVIGFQYQSDAAHFLQAMRERLSTFGLELHSEKTRLIEFGRHAEANRQHVVRANQKRLISLDLHICVRRPGKIIALPCVEKPLPNDYEAKSKK